MSIYGPYDRNVLKQALSFLSLRVLAIFVLVTAIFTPLAVEFGQVALPGKIPDTTDLLLGWVGGLLGFAIVLIYRLRASIVPQPSREAARVADVQLGGETGDTMPASREVQRSSSELPTPMRPEENFRTRWYEPTSSRVSGECGPESPPRGRG